MKKSIISVILAFVLSLFAYSQKGDEATWELQLAKYSKIYSLIKQNFPGKFDKEKLFFSSIKGFLNKLDPHSSFHNALSQRSLNEDMQGNYFGIGIRITKYEDRLTVLSAMEGGPAKKLGVMPGDVIVKINKKGTKNLSLDDSMKLLRGAKDTLVSFEIHRESNDIKIPFQIKRAEIPLNSVSISQVHPVNQDIGYIKIRTFGNTTAKEFTKGADKQLKEGIKALIIDLRGNRGGSLYSAIDIAGLFLQKGKPIVSIKGKKLNQKFRATKSPKYQNLPLAILINRESASASEIVASAFQDHKRAIIIGSRSWGKGLVQTVYKLPLNTSLALSTAKYYTPLNKCLQRDFSSFENYASILYDKTYDTNTEIKGGVFPDIYVQIEYYPSIIANLISKGVFFKFSIHLIDENHKIGKKFKAGNHILKKFRKFLNENKITYDPKELKKNIDFVKYEIELEVISNKFSSDKGFNVFLKSDPVSKKAVSILSNKLKKENKQKNE
jgi:carboxyl-terminal processing protease